MPATSQVGVCHAAITTAEQFGDHLKYLTSQDVYGDERGLTDYLVACIRHEFGVRAYVQKHGSHDEVWSGADLELYIETELGWIDLLVQAKAERSDRAFHNIKKKVGRSYQINQLKKTASENDLHPVYFFYSDAHPDPNYFSIGILNASTVKSHFHQTSIKARKVVMHSGFFCLPELICTYCFSNFLQRGGKNFFIPLKKFLLDAGSPKSKMARRTLGSMMDLPVVGRVRVIILREPSIDRS